MEYVKPVVVNNNPNEDRPTDFYKTTASGDRVIYTDFDFALNVHPITGDFIMRNNTKAIIQSLRNLVLSAAGEFLMDGEIGGGVDSMMFELNEPITAFTVQKRVTQTIQNHESRIDLKSVEVFKSPDRYGLIIEVTFFFANQPEPFTERILLERVR